ncbi:MAG TPA: erythromycin esterase family protein [Pyrinomonadaceae bacterium]|jgi:erythromycin esterase-like protein|nr:erythromycin esterase family protein [Pyrinomonadaceae bacterium]
MTIAKRSLVTNAVKAESQALQGDPRDYDPLLELVHESRFCLLGEATHGTHEFYRERAEITKRLIKEKGFTAVAVEADWPDAFRINRYVRALSDDRDANEALGGFKRFPTWMWRNTVVLDFVEWLRDYNSSLPVNATKVGFYGLDLYSLYASIESVLGYLDKIDPAAAKRARYRYSCFEHFSEDTQAYGYAASFGITESCEREVIEQLVELRRRAAEYASRDGQVARDEFFFAEQNARLVLNAERYYRTMFRGRVESWNLRDRHMAETLDALVTYLDTQGHPAKVAVWEHNSHLGDARATYMADYGELNVGQLVRERYGPDSVLIGFTTYTGTVTAASDWDGPAERKRVRPALENSYEASFHDVDKPNFLLPLRDAGPASIAVRDPSLERAIGVIYLPRTERQSHYFEARLADQFDAVIHFDETQALEPLERHALWETGEPPETFPTGV